MNKIRQFTLTTLFVIFCLVFMGYPVSADDTCVFSVTADDLPPNIVLLLDNGAEMEQIVWHDKYDNTVDYTPVAGLGLDVVTGLPGADGFYNASGYSITSQGGKYYLVDIPSDLDVSHYNDRLIADASDTVNKTGTWKINGREITLPAVPSTVKVGQIIDNAVHFRYSKNYLNWLFFGPYDVDGAGDGSDLPNMTRFYKAKEAIMSVAKLTEYKAYFGIYYFANATGGSQAQPLKFAVKAKTDGLDDDGVNGIDDFGEILTSEFVNNINNMLTVTYSPLAEGLSTVGYYLSSPSSGAYGGYCQQNYALVISPGVSSEDQGTPSQHVPASLSDYDEDNTGIVEGNIVEDNTHDGTNNDGDAETDEADEAVTYTIPVNQNGSTYLDDVAYYLWANDIVADVAGTGSLCFDEYSALADPTDLSLTFKVGGTVTGGTSTATGIITAVNVNVGGASGCLELSSISGNFTDDEMLTGSTGGSARVNGLLFDSGQGFQNVFTYTVGFMGDKEGDLFLINTSNNGNGNRYLYNTSDEEYGKYHFNADSPDDLADQLMAAVNSILSRTSTFMAPVVPVTRTTSGNRIYMAFFKPNKGNFWEGNVTKYGIFSDEIVDKWDQPATYDNGAMIETAEPYWATADWAGNINYAARRIYTSLNGTDLIQFVDANLTDPDLGTPARGKTDIINYVRGADILDENENTVTLENRSVITGDVLHSEPVIFQYKYDNGTYTTMVYFGANDGMLHAVLDEDTHVGSLTPGSEMWAFIPTDLLPRLKDMIEGVDHQYYVDSTPKIYFKDVDGDGNVDSGDGDKVILVCGERKGGTGYFALDVTNPVVTNPLFPNFSLLWTINQNSATYSPTHVISKLGQTWSEPQFGVVKDNVGSPIPVLFVGGGYDDSATPTTGNAVLVINVTNGDIVRYFNGPSTPVTDMNYPIPSNVLVVDENGNGYVDKVYVGDLGGQMWRIGGVTANDFNNFNENIYAWTAQVFFKTDSGNSRKFFYPPSVTLEKGFDMVFMGTGNREESCCNNRNNLCSFTGPDIIAAVKETHSSTTLVGVGGTDLVDVTDPAATPPDLTTDDGWYIRLVDDIDQAVGEKVLAENIVFYKTLYITTFLPNEDPCAPGGDGKLYALSYLTGQPVLDFDGDSINDRSYTIGGGIPSKPVTLITRTGTRLLISVGSSNPDPAVPSTGAGIMNITPLVPPINFFYKYWREF